MRLTGVAPERATLPYLRELTRALPADTSAPGDIGLVPQL